MKKLVSFNMITLDGYFEGQNEDISWHKVDEEVNDFIIEQLKTADTLLFGRKTFKAMEEFWPSKKTFELDPLTAKLMSSHTKIVFSTTRKNTTWKNTRWINENVVKEIKKLKEQEGKNIFVFGSSDLCKLLIKNNLIDEFRLMVNPVTLGTGNPFFKTKLEMRLLKVKVFGSGNVLLYYQPKE